MSASLALSASLGLAGCQAARSVAPAPAVEAPPSPVVEFYEGETTVFAPSGERIAEGRVFLKRVIDPEGYEIREEIVTESTLKEAREAGQISPSVQVFVVDGTTLTVVDGTDEVNGTGQIEPGRWSATTHSGGGTTLELIREQTSRGFFTEARTFDARGVTVSRSEGRLQKITSERFVRETARLAPSGS